MMETSPVSDVPSVGPTEEDGFRGGREFTVMELDPHLEVALPLLRRRWETLHRMSYMPPLWHTDRQEVEDEINSISQTLGAALLEHIVITDCNASLRRKCKLAGQPRQLDIPSLVQDINALQVKLGATMDEYEQRALEEDITGKILWLFLCGICIEVDELLPKESQLFHSHG